jgi:hypothetical protein
VDALWSAATRFRSIVGPFSTSGEMLLSSQFIAMSWHSVFEDRVPAASPQMSHCTLSMSNWGTTDIVREYHPFVSPRAAADNQVW